MRVASSRRFPATFVTCLFFTTYPTTDVYSIYPFDLTKRRPTPDEEHRFRYKSTSQLFTAFLRVKDFLCCGTPWEQRVSREAHWRLPASTTPCTVCAHLVFFFDFTTTRNGREAPTRISLGLLLCVCHGFASRFRVGGLGFAFCVG